MTVEGNNMAAFRFASARYRDREMGPLPQLLARSDFPEHVDPSSKLVGVRNDSVVLSTNAGLEEVPMMDLLDVVETPLMLSRSNLVLPTRVKPTSGFTRSQPCKSVEDSRRVALTYPAKIGLRGSPCAALCHDIECHYVPDLHRDGNSVQDVLLFATFCSTCGYATCSE